MPKATQQAKNHEDARPQDVPMLPLHYAVRIGSLYMEGDTKATASIEVNGQFAVHGVRVMLEDGALAVRMPGYEREDGYHEICAPNTSEERGALNAAVLSEFLRAPHYPADVQDEEAAQGPPEPLPLRYDVKFHTLRPGNGAQKGTATVSLNGQFDISQVTVMQGRNGLFVSMPSYIGRSGAFKDYCFPCTKESRAAFDAAVLDAYGQALAQYQEDVQALQRQPEAPVPFEEGPHDGGPVMQM